MIGLGSYMVAQQVEAINNARNINDYSNNYSVTEIYQPKDLISRFAKGTIGYVLGDNGYEMFIPTGINELPVEKDELLVVTVKDMVTHARKTFGLNVVQIASLTGVSRATLYNHLHESEQPSSIEVYQQLYAVSEAVRSATSFKIKAGLKSVVVDGKTLLSHLKKSLKDTQKIVNVCMQIEDKLMQVNSRSHLSTEQQRRISRSHSTMG